MQEAWLPIISASLVAFVLVRWAQAQRAGRRYAFLHDLCCASLLILCWHTNLWHRITQGYPGDSIHTLSFEGQVGLIILSLLLSCILVYISIAKTRILIKLARTHQRVTGVLPLSDAILTAALFWIAISVVPQLHYLYYQTLFEQLPAQWVIKAIDPSAFWRLLRIPFQANLAQHATALAGWLLFAITLFDWLRKYTLDRHGYWMAAAGFASCLSWQLLVA